MDWAFQLHPFGTKNGILKNSASMEAKKFQVNTLHQGRGLGRKIAGVQRYKEGWDKGWCLVDGRGGHQVDRTMWGGGGRPGKVNNQEIGSDIYTK